MPCLLLYSESECGCRRPIEYLSSCVYFSVGEERTAVGYGGPYEYSSGWSQHSSIRHLS